jgi:hypothetical protein
LPITAKILPYQKNLAYLATTAVITRMGIAGMRVWENRPANNDDPALTPNQKRQGMLERFFVEVPGTLLFTVLPLHLGQDLAAKVFENASSRLAIPQIRPTRGKSGEKSPAGPPVGLRDDEVKTINRALIEVFGRYNAETNTHEPVTADLIYRRLFGQSKPVTGGKPGATEVVTASLASLKARLGDELYAKAKAALPSLEKGFAMALNRSTCWSILGGVLMSATCGGWLTQRLNDSTVAPAAKQWLSRHYPEKMDKSANPTVAVPQGEDKGPADGAAKSPSIPPTPPPAQPLQPSQPSRLLPRAFPPATPYALPPSIPLTYGMKPGAYLAYAGLAPERSS